MLDDDSHLTRASSSRVCNASISRIPHSQFLIPSRNHFVLSLRLTSHVAAQRRDLECRIARPHRLFIMS